MMGGASVLFQARREISDREIIELYWARDERAVNETDMKYGKYLSAVIHNILNDDRDCEECLDDTYIGAWSSMPPSKPNVLKAFLMTIARRVAINRYHGNNRKNLVPSEMELSLSELENYASCGNVMI